MPEPLGETTVTRSWRWGAAVVGDPSAAPPTPTAAPVTTGTGALVLRLRRDTATVHVRVLAALGLSSRTTLCDVVLETPGGKLSLGDAAEAVVIEADGASRHRLVVSAEQVPDDGLAEVWVDVVPNPQT